MEIHLKIIGALLLSLSVVHVIFPRYFNWKEELRHLSLINRQMMVVHTFFIALTVGMVGVLCLTSAPALIATPLGQTICLGLGVFWAIRLVIQLFGYSPNLWRAKPFETVVHIAFTLFWAYMVVIFLWVSAT